VLPVTLGNRRHAWQLIATKGKKMQAIQKELDRARTAGIDARQIKNPNKATRKDGAAGSTYSPSRVLWLDGRGYSLGGARQYIDARIR